MMLTTTTNVSVDGVMQGLFAGYRGVMPDPDNNPIAGLLNARPKYVVSNTLTDPQWANTTVLSGDAIGELKAKPGGELQVHGSGALIRWLLDNRLVDEMNLNRPTARPQYATA